MQKQWRGIDGTEDQWSEHLASVPGCGALSLALAWVITVSLSPWRDVLWLAVGDVFDDMWNQCWGTWQKTTICFSSWGLFQSLQKQRSILKRGLRPKFEHCLIRQVGELFLLIEWDSEVTPKPKPTPNMGLHASEWSTPRLIRHYKVCFFILSHYFNVNRLQCFAWGGAWASRAGEPSERIIGVSGCG